MRRTVFVAAVILLSGMGAAAQQHNNIDAQKSSLTIHVGKTGVDSQGWDTNTKFARPFTAVRQTPALTLRLKYTWTRGNSV